MITRFAHAIQGKPGLGRSARWGWVIRSKKPAGEGGRGGLVKRWLLMCRAALWLGYLGSRLRKAQMDVAWGDAMGDVAAMSKPEMTQDRP